jgi:cell division transport system permease protein
MVTAVRYSFEEALQGLSRRKLVTFLSTITIAVSLGVLGLVLALGRSGRILVETLAEKAQVVIYLRPDVAPLVRDGLLRAVREARGVASAEFRSSDEALLRFKALFPDLAAVPEEIGANPFPPSIEVALRPGVTATTAAEAGGGLGAEGLVATWLKNPAVTDVQYDAALVSRIAAFVRLLRGAGVLVAVILGVAAVFTITNVIRLSIYAREDEIEIMRLVGAPAAYIRGPFLAEGALEGVSGGLIATALSGLALQSVAEALRDMNFGATLAPHLGRDGFLLLVLLGASVGLAGSFLSLGRLRT